MRLGQVVGFVRDWAIRGTLIAVLVFVVLDTVGCSAKKKAKFEKVSSDICDIVEEYEPLAQGINDAAVPEGDARLAIGLTLDEARHQCERFRKIQAAKDD